MNEASQNALWVEELEIRHFAGVRPQHAFRLEKLSPGINIIYGPNGCGKSTTAKAIQQLIWPETQADFSELNATVHWREDHWNLITRGREVKNLVDSEYQNPPDWAPPETRMRYNWSLQNLLQGKDGELARQIAREMAGGIDFQELAAALNLQKKPSAPSGLHKDYLHAEKKLRETKATQHALKQESLTLAELKQQCAEALAHAQQAPLLEQAIELSAKKKQLQQLNEELSAFPAGMKDLLRDDAEELQKSVDQLNKIREELLSLKQQRAALGTGEEDWGTVSEQDFQSATKELEHHLHQIEEMERECKEAEKEFLAFESEQQQLYTSIGIHAKAALELGDGFDYPEIQEWVQQIFKISSLQERCKLLQDALPEANTAPANHTDIESLREARRNLEAWLQCNLPTKKTSMAGFIYSAFLLTGILIAFILMRSLPWYAILLVLPGIGLHLHFQKKTDDKRSQELQARHPKSLPQPETWEVDTVRELLPQIDGFIREAYANELHCLDQRRLAEVQSELTQAEAVRVQLKEKLETAGLDLKEDPMWMAHFLQTVKSWRELRVKTRVAEEHWNALSEARARRQADLEKRLKEWGHRERALSLHVAVKDICERIQTEISRRHQQASLDIKNKYFQQQATEKQAEISKRCQRAHLSEPDIRTLRERVGLISEWEKKMRQAASLQARISELEEKWAAQLDSLPTTETELKSQWEACAQSVNRERELREQINRLEERIDGRKKGSEVHAAEENLASIREELLQQRSRYAEAQAGIEILNWLQEKCRSRDRSQVMEAANRNLSLFSKGSLQLHLSEVGNGEEFSASTAGHPPQPLNRLSSGERTQLLMAVRLAFLSLNEHAPLPLLVDEALGTTDDVRGEELIQALIEVSKQGRQLFYFTAQQDEVNKWRQVMDAAGIEGHFIDLAALRANTRAAPLPKLLATKTEIKNLNRHLGESLGDWGKRLLIPAWHPQQAVEDLSLWFLLHENIGLLQKLFNRGIQSVGHWITYEQADGLASWVDESDRVAVNQRIKIIQSLQKTWQIGRPPPVSLAEVLKSGAVTDKFADDVGELLSEVNGDAQKLIQGLKDKKVQGFFQQKAHDLESYLHEQGYLSDTPALSEHEIKAQVMAIPESEALAPDEWNVLSDLFFT
ncbi:AAA family ATPase [Kiritimatiellaeota bacterium B1221]|nr:AAA family ATPase [Kiritimatiellaeota bacterium B1221]